MKHRLFIALLLALLWVSAIVARLHHLQVDQHEVYAQRAARQQQRIVSLDPPRGTIRDARGRELAVSAEVLSVYAVPREIEDPAAAAADLAPVVGRDRARLAHELGQRGEFVWVGRKLDRPKGRAVQELGLDGIYFVPENKRYYPMRGLAAQVIGYAGTDNQGLAGLESHYDALIAGTPARRTVLRDARQTTALHPSLTLTHAQPGLDLELTVDASIQYVVEKELARAVSAHGARRGVAVVLEPHTGAVLAMATVPGFDPNRFASASPERWRNRAVMDAYEPGSTFKVVTAAGALEHHLFGPFDRIDCEMGAITLAHTRIRDHKPFGVLTFREVFTHSSNVGAVKTGLALGNERFHDVIQAFGFGRRTGIDLPGESHGIVPPLSRWGGLTRAYVGFGQGISVTPIQLVTAVGAIANGGRLMRPYVVARVGEKERKPEVVGHPIAPSTVRQVRQLLEEVVEEGTGGGAAVAGYRVAGKTGTAQKPAPGGGYSRDRVVASFVGYVPAADPALVGLVLLDEPTRGVYGGEIAAPTFARIAGQVLLYLGAPPETRAAPAWPATAALLAASPRRPGDGAPREDAL